MLLKREISFISGVKNSKKNTLCINKVVLSLHILCIFPVSKPNILSKTFYFCCEKSIGQQSYNFLDKQSSLLNHWQGPWICGHSLY